MRAHYERDYAHRTDQTEDNDGVIITDHEVQAEQLTETRSTVSCSITSNSKFTLIYKLVK